MSTKYTFREITEKDELEQFFRLRFEVYSGCRCRSILKNNGHSIDIDYYDVHSRHYAMTCGNTNAGYFRVVLAKEELIQQSVIDIAENYNIFRNYDRYLNSEAAPFPFLCYKEVPQSYWNYYKNLKRGNKNLAEASRLILIPELRTIRTSKFLIECAIVLYLIICFGRRQAVLSCNQRHKSFYEYYGFNAIGEENGLSTYGYDSLAMSLVSLPDQHHLRLKEMTSEFKSNGKIEREL
jgi:predicted GNAT family N-acyltransferase